MLKWVAYYLGLPFLFGLSILPLRVLYLFSDLAFLLVYYLFRYRRELVFQNMRNAFPEMAEDELWSLHRRFFRHFCDLFVEILKSFTIRPAELKRRMKLDADNPAIELAYGHRSAIVALGHYGNWEWFGLRASLTYPEQMYAIYRPLKNPGFNRLIFRRRQRFGMRLYTMKDTLRGMLANRNRSTFTCFLTDQAPPPENAIWLEFLNQDTPVFAGTEKIARKLGFPVLFVSCNKVRRGYYEMTLKWVTQDPAACAPGEITARHTRLLEEEIRRAPAYWLWSHRRWKHKRPEA